MTEEESISKMPEESYSSSNASRQRRKRKWDQPAEAIVSAAFHMPSVFPPSSIAAATGLTIPVVASPSIAVPTVLLPTTSASIPQVYQAPLAYQNAASIVHKMNQEATAKVVGLHLQPKIQDELIAREIVINDAESAIRYKLTKRQTQEEIQKCTGAVVITRGKYRPPSAVQDIEKPLYLHISAGAHLHDTAERIKAVDSAAALIEDIMRQGQHGHPASAAFLPIASTTNQETQPLSVSLFLGFDVDPSMNIAARIRGPNDQYINHIMNETGATVVLKGRGSGNADNVSGEESQPLHLYLSSNNLKSLEAAKLLAENLLDTISVECGATRVSTSKAYNAVPPPQQLLVGVRTSTGIEENKISDRIAAASDCLATTSTALPSSSVVAISPAVAVVSTAHSQATGPPGVVNCGQPPLTTANHCPPSFTGGTNYNGYGGIYPQSTPLQQVALALIQPPTQALPVQVPSSDTTTKSPGAEKPQTGQRSHRRKFQELPTEAKGSKETEFLKPGNFSERQSSRSLLSMPSPKKFLPPSSNGMPPPPPKFLSRPPQGKMPPPPPPKFTSQPPKRENPQSNDKKVDDGPASEFLLKLAEYGDDDDDEGVNEKSHGSDLRSPSLSAKPFWAA